MKRITPLIALLLVCSLCGCMAGRAVKTQVNKVATKTSNTYHAKSYSKALIANAPRLIGTWSKVDTLSFGKTHVNVTSKKLSLFSDQTYTHRTHHYTTSALLLTLNRSNVERGGVRSSMPESLDLYHQSGKYGVDIDKGTVTSSRGSWQKIGLHTIKTISEKNAYKHTIDLSDWTNQHPAPHINWPGNQVGQ